MDEQQALSDSGSQTPHAREPNTPTKFCKFCAHKIPMDAVICTACGRQVEELKSAPSQPNIIITNTNTNTNHNNAAGLRGREKNKWVAIWLCFFLGVIGVHKFYEGKILLGILYFFTFGLCGIGVIVDLINLVLKPNPYYVGK